MDCLQEFLDEKKEELTDGLYNELCKLSLAAYKTQDIEFYEIKY